MHYTPPRHGIETHPIMLRPTIYPDILKPLKIRLLIDPAAPVPPEETRHAGKGVTDDHLARRTGRLDTCAAHGVERVDVHAQSLDLHLANVQWAGRVGGDE